MKAVVVLLVDLLDASGTLMSKVTKLDHIQQRKHHRNSNRAAPCESASTSIMHKQ